MEKITLSNIHTLKIGDIIARYPTNGDIINTTSFKDAEVTQSEITVLMIQNISEFGIYKLGYSVLGFSQVYKAEIHHNIDELTNGRWWKNIDTSIYS